MNLWNILSAIFSPWSKGTLEQRKQAQARPATETNLAGLMVRTAIEEIGVRETSRNQGPGIAKYWTETSYQDGFRNREPWCAAFGCWVVAEACRRRFHDDGPRFKLPRSARAFDWIDWAAANPRWVVRVAPDMPLRPGDIIIYPFSHWGLVEKPEGGVACTIEGNTNDGGGREGIEVARMRRTRRSDWTVLRIVD